MTVRRIARDSRLAPALPTVRYACHRPEATLLYELVDRHNPAFLAALEQDGRRLPTFMQQEFDGLSVPFPLRFLLATEPAAVTAVLGIVYRAIATSSRAWRPWCRGPGPT